MKLSNFIFRESFVLRTKYDTIVHHIKEHLNEKYYKGYLGRDELQVFFLSGILKSTFSPLLPVFQVNIENTSGKNGEVFVRFKIVNFVLILSAAIILLLSFSSLVNIDPRR